MLIDLLSLTPIFSIKIILIKPRRACVNRMEIEHINCVATVHCEIFFLCKYYSGIFFSHIAICVHRENVAQLFYICLNNNVQINSKV